MISFSSSQIEIYGFNKINNTLNINTIPLVGQVDNTTLNVNSSNCWDGNCNVSSFVLRSGDKMHGDLYIQNSTLNLLISQIGKGINITSAGQFSPSITFSNLTAELGVIGLALQTNHYSNRARYGDFVYRAKTGNFIWAINETDDLFYSDSRLNMTIANNLSAKYYFGNGSKLHSLPQDTRKVNISGDTMTGTLYNSATDWFIGKSGVTDVFRCGTSIFGIVSCTSANNQALYLGSDDANQRMVFADTTTGTDAGSLGFVANQYIGFYLGDLLVETIRYKINRTAFDYYQESNYNNYPVYNIGNIAQRKQGANLTNNDYLYSNHTKALNLTTNMINNVRDITCPTNSTIAQWNITSGTYTCINVNYHANFSRTGTCSSLDVVYQNNRSIPITIEGSIEAGSSAKLDSAYVIAKVGANPPVTEVQHFGLISEGNSPTSDDIDAHAFSFHVAPFQNYTLASTIVGSGTLSLQYCNEVTR